MRSDSNGSSPGDIDFLTASQEEEDNKQTAKNWENFIKPLCSADGSKSSSVNSIDYDAFIDRTTVIPDEMLVSIMNETDWGEASAYTKSIFTLEKVRRDRDVIFLQRIGDHNEQKEIPEGVLQSVAKTLEEGEEGTLRPLSLVGVKKLIKAFDDRKISYNKIKLISLAQDDILNQYSQGKLTGEYKILASFIKRYQAFAVERKECMEKTQDQMMMNRHDDDFRRNIHDLREEFKKTVNEGLLYDHDFLNNYRYIEQGYKYDGNDVFQINDAFNGFPWEDGDIKNISVVKFYKRFNQEGNSEDERLLKKVSEQVLKQEIKNLNAQIKEKMSTIKEHEEKVERLRKMGILALFLESSRRNPYSSMVNLAFALVFVALGISALNALVSPVIALPALEAVYFWGGCLGVSTLVAGRSMPEIHWEDHREINYQQEKIQTLTGDIASLKDEVANKEEELKSLDREVKRGLGEGLSVSSVPSAAPAGTEHRTAMGAKTKTVGNHLSNAKALEQFKSVKVEEAKPGPGAPQSKSVSSK